jgi:hypothetical protein
MVISHKYKYLFIENPHSASTAISRELCEKYDGKTILHKHAIYHEFKRNANAQELNYFTFACIRNPLDEAVSLYYKLKSNHKGKYTNPKRLAKYGGSVTKWELKKYKFIKDNNADFTEFCKRFYNLPYGSIIELSAKHCDFIMRFENLQDDFSEALRLIGVEQKRSLPQQNKTDEKEADFLSYVRPEIYNKTKRIFGPFMKKHGYDLPHEWGDISISLSNWMSFYCTNILRKLYWRFVRTSPRVYAQLLRKMR